MVGETRRRLATLALVLATGAAACGDGGAFDEAAALAGSADAPVVVQEAPAGTAQGAVPAGQPVATANASEAVVADPGAGTAPSPGTTTGSGQGASPTRPVAPPPSTGGTAKPPSPSLPAAPAQQGLTSDTIKLGFVKLGSWQNLGENFGVISIDWGDIDAQAAALVDWVNANGGIDGRTVEYVVKEYKQEDASADLEAQICNSLADDEKVWGVVLQGQIHFSTRKCYADKGILVLDPSPFSFDDDIYAENSPFLFSPSTPSITRVARTLPKALAERGWMDPLASRSEVDAKLGIVHWDDPYARRVIEEDLQPTLDGLGWEVTLMHAIDNTDAGTIQSGITNGIVRFQTAGINRVLFIGGNPIAPLWFLNAEQYRFNPRYGLTTFDGPAHTTQQTPNQMQDALGIGFNPVHDVHDEQHAFPAPDNPTEQFCVKVMADAGQAFAGRRNAEIGLAYCEALLLLRAGAAGLGDALSAQNWASQVETLGSTFRAAVSFKNLFGPGRHDGGLGYRLTEHRADCGCFHYTGDVRTFA